VSSTPLRFDPSTNTWAHIASGLPSAGAGGVLKAAIDPNDNIYVYGDVSGAMARYNQATDTWTTLATGPSGMFRTGTPQFFQGKLYLFGVSASNTNIYVYDPATNAWATTGDTLSAARNNLGTIQDANGVYIVGGLTASGTGSAVVEYWSPTVVASGHARGWAAVIG
jgi:N-acetylneuraminic acid mutarotase